MHTVHTCKAIQHEAELAPLLDLIKDSRVIVELGTLHGGTFHALCWAAHPEALCISIDLERTPTEAGGGAALPYDELASHAQPGQTVVQILGDTHSADTQRRLEQALDGRMVDALLIDADHHYHAVAQDHEDYQAFVKPGGIIAFHDIHRSSGHQAGCEVDRYWADTKPTLGDDVYEYVVQECEMGIGAYRKP